MASQNKQNVWPRWGAPPVTAERLAAYRELEGLIPWTMDSNAFGPHKLFFSRVFLCSKHALAVVNIKCFRPGHVLIVSRRVVPRTEDMTTEEKRDLWRLLRLTRILMEDFYGCDRGCTVSTQNGPLAGQTVPHVHYHIVPHVPERKPPYLNKQYQNLQAMEVGLLKGWPQDRKSFMLHCPWGIREDDAQTNEAWNYWRFIRYYLTHEGKDLHLFQLKTQGLPRSLSFSVGEDMLAYRSDGGIKRRLSHL